MRLSEFLSNGLPINLQKGETVAVTVHGAVQRVLQRFPEVDASDLDEDIDHLLTWLDDCRKKDDWTGVKWRHAASAARAIFIPPRSLLPKWDRLRDLLVRTLDHDHKRSFARASYSAYLEGFDPDNVLTQRLARGLSNSWHHTLPQIKPVVDRFDLFQVRGLDRRVAEYMAAQERPYDVLKRIGIPTPHMNGLFQLSYRRFVDLRRKAVARQDKDAVQQVLHWLHPDAETRLVEGQSRAIDALLEPWSDETPTKEIQDRIRSELIEAYGDPRLSTAGWSRVSEDALAVIRRWLTGSSLEQFLEVVSAVEGSHMWEPRRKFWLSVHAQGLIDEAWVVLSPQGSRRARELAQRSDDKGFLSHGRVTDSGSEARCYLILRCGKGIVVEGSHSFSVRFYKPSNEHCPSLYGDRYSQYSFNPNTADARVPHQGAWQGKVQVQLARIRNG